MGCFLISIIKEGDNFGAKTIKVKSFLRHVATKRL